LAAAEFVANVAVGNITSEPKRQANMALYENDIFPPFF
jgi:hypothetical protein